MKLGIFDSGLGGLTVLREILKNNTYDEIVYYGDTLRMPYGDKDPDTLITYAKEDIDFLLNKGVNEIVVACGTISANALPIIKDDYKLRIIGIIEAGVKAAVKVSRNKKIGIIATSATIKNGAFKKALLENNVEVYESACPLLTPLIETGDLNSKALNEALVSYLEPLKKEGIDTLILGCTHYPLLDDKIKAYLPGVCLINVGESLAESLCVGERKKADLSFYVSGDPDDFKNKAQLFMDTEIVIVNKED